MGFLEALGRAKPADDILGAVGKYANIQHTNAATQNVQANTALSAESLEMAKIKRNQEQYQLNKIQEQETFDKQVTPVDSHPFFKTISSIAPSVHKDILEEADALGFSQPIPGTNQKMMSNKDFKRYQKYWEENPLVFQKHIGEGINEITAQMSQLEQQKQQLPPNDKNSQAASAQIDQQLQQLQNTKLYLTSNASKLQEEIEKEKATLGNKIILEQAKTLSSLSIYKKKKQIAQQYPAPVNPVSAEYKDLAIDMKTINELNKEEKDIKGRLIVKQEDIDAFNAKKKAAKPVYDRLAKKLGIEEGGKSDKAVPSKDIPVIAKTMQSLVDKKVSDKQIYDGIKKKLTSMGYSPEQADNTIREAWRSLKGKK